MMKEIEKRIKLSNLIVDIAYYGIFGAAFLIILIKLFKILRS
jgi:hypothetical protein